MKYLSKTPVIKMKRPEGKPPYTLSQVGRANGISNQRVWSLLGKSNVKWADQ